MKAVKIYPLFGVGQTTGQDKSKQVQDLMHMHQMEPNWSLPTLRCLFQTEQLCSIGSGAVESAVNKLTADYKFQAQNGTWNP